MTTAGTVALDGDELELERLEQRVRDYKYQYEKCYREVKELRQLNDARAELIDELRLEIRYLRNRLEAQGK